MLKRAILFTLMLVILLMPCAGAAQTVSLGVIGGVPVTPAFDAASAFEANGTTVTGPTLPATLAEVDYTSREKPFTFGPTIEVSLPRGFALEFDALYKRLNYNVLLNQPVSSPLLSPGQLLIVEEEHNIVSRWDLPLFLKYRVKQISAYRPYFAGGLNTNYVVNTTQVGFSGYVFSPVGPIPATTIASAVKSSGAPAELRYRSAEGVVVAAGSEFRFHRIRLAPELRYTRWAHENFHEVTSVGKLRSNLNQAEILVTVGLAK